MLLLSRHENEVRMEKVLEMKEMGQLSYMYVNGDCLMVSDV